MSELQSESRVRILHLDVADEWTINELSSLLRNLDMTYRRLNVALLSLEDILNITNKMGREEQRHGQGAADEPRTARDKLDVGTMFEVDYRPTIYMQSVSLATRRFGHLVLHSMHISSPGMIETISSMITDKTIVTMATLLAGAIAHWRHEDTVRYGIHQASLTEREKSKYETAAKIAQSIAEAKGALVEGQVHAVMEALSEFSQADAEDTLARIGKDDRIKAVSYREVD